MVGVSFCSHAHHSFGSALNFSLLFALVFGPFHYLFILFHAVHLFFLIIIIIICKSCVTLYISLYITFMKSFWGALIKKQWHSMWHQELVQNTPTTLAIGYNYTCPTILNLLHKVNWLSQGRGRWVGLLLLNIVGRQHSKLTRAFYSSLHPSIINHCSIHYLVTWGGRGRGRGRCDKCSLTLSCP